MDHDEKRRVVLHEFGHALGFAHEHQNKNAPIQWNEQGVLDYYADKLGWDSEDTKHNILNPLSDDNVTSLAFSSDGKMIASGGDNRQTSRLIQIWDPRTGQPLKICEGDVTPINSIAFSPDGKTLASASGQGASVRLWIVNE